MCQTDVRSHNRISRCRFDPDTDDWMLLESMTSRRVGAGVVTVNRLLFAMGGFDGVNRLKTVECYYPEHNEWRFVAPMHTARSGAGACQCHNKHLL